MNDCARRRRAGVCPPVASRRAVANYRKFANPEADLRNCRPGDVALIVKDEPMLGQINHDIPVLVLPEFVIRPEGFYWRVESLGRELAWQEWGTDFFGGYSRLVYHLDAWLKPWRAKELLGEKSRALEVA